MYTFDQKYFGTDLATHPYISHTVDKYSTIYVIIKNIIFYLLHEVIYDDKKSLDFKYLYQIIKIKKLYIHYNKKFNFNKYYILNFVFFFIYC